MDMGLLIDPDHHECCGKCCHSCVNDGKDVKGSVFVELVCRNENSINYGMEMDFVECCDDYEAE